MTSRTHQVDVVFGFAFNSVLHFLVECLVAVGCVRNYRGILRITFDYSLASFDWKAPDRYLRYNAQFRNCNL